MASDTNNSTDLTNFYSVPNTPNTSQEESNDNERSMGATGTSKSVIVNHGSANEAASVTQTITIVKEDIKNRLPTLVLKLKNDLQSLKSRNDDETISEQEKKIKQQLEDFRKQFLDYADKMEQAVLAVQPKTGDPDYEEKKKAYLAMVQLVMKIIEKLQNMFDNLFSQYSKFFDDLADTIKNGDDSKKVVKNFISKVEKEHKDAWKPFIDVLDLWKSENIDATNQNRNENYFSSSTKTLSPMSIHYGYTCEACEKKDINGLRFKCAECTDYNLCFTCFGERKETKQHSCNHQMLSIPKPIDHDQSLKDIANTKDAIKVDVQKLQTGITNMLIFSENVKHSDKEIQEAKEGIQKMFQQLKDSVSSQTDNLEKKITIELAKMNIKERETFLGGVTKSLQSFKALIDELMRNIYHAVDSICGWIKGNVGHVVEHIKNLFQVLRTKFFE